MQQRVVAIDLLRGFLLCVIMIDHLERFPGLFDTLTGQGQLWVSAAEGFFFISGMMVGLVRGRQILRDGFRAVWRKLWTRTAQLYLWSIGLTLLITWLGWHVAGGGLSSGDMSPDQPEGALWQSVLSLEYVYGWVDYLPRYVLFLLVSPLALYLVWRRLSWLVLALSLLAWCFRGDNFYLAWQILFFSGLVVGWNLERLETAWLQLNRSLRQSLVISGGVITVGSYLLSSYFSYHPPTINLEPYFFRESMQPGRLLLFTIWFGTAYLLFRTYEAWIQRWFGWLLEPLGSHSLYVYILSGALIFSLNLIFPENFSWAINALLDLTLIGTVWLAASCRFLFKLIPR